MAKRERNENWEEEKRSLLFMEIAYWGSWYVITHYAQCASCPGNRLSSLSYHLPAHVFFLHEGNNQFRIFLLHLNDLNPVIHHTSHHNKLGPTKNEQSRKNYFLHHIKSILDPRVSVCAECVLASINSPSLSRVSLAFRVTFFFFFSSRDFCSLRKNVLLV